MNRCPKCKSFRSPGHPCKRCGDPAPEMVRCDRADECQVTNCYHAKTHWPHSACISKGCAYYQNPNARCIPVLTTETAVVPETPEPPPAPDSPAECAECAKLREELADMRINTAAVRTAVRVMEHERDEARAELSRERAIVDALLRRKEA